MSNKRLKLLILALATLALGSILFAACARPGSPESNTSAQSGNGGNSNSGGGGTTVHMGPTNFLQSSVSIPKGSKLTLIDDVAVPHILKNGMWDANGNQILKKEPGAPTVDQMFNGSDTHDIGPFDTAGTFHILCTIHPNMNLVVTVK